MNKPTLPDNSKRRPLKSRGFAWAHRGAQYLANLGITPNQISFAGVFVSAVAFMGLWHARTSDSWKLSALLILVAFACQLRLICNLLDGLVAVESGKHTPSGAVWNELPDRVSDIIVFVGIGVFINQTDLAWAVAALAVTVAYVRELGGGIDGVMDYSGPMAKQHRMALVIASLLIAALLEATLDRDPTYTLGDFQFILNAGSVLQVCLWVCALGCIVTIVKRVSGLLRRL